MNLEQCGCWLTYWEIILSVIHLKSKLVRVAVDLDPTPGRKVGILPECVEASPTQDILHSLQAQI